MAQQQPFGLFRLPQAEQAVRQAYRRLGDEPAPPRQACAPQLVGLPEVPLGGLEIARELGRSVASIANKANQLGLRKSPALLARIGRANVAIRYTDGG